MGELTASGISVPEQIAVTGFDGIAAGLISRPPLTTIRQPMELMGRTAVGILLDRFEHPGEPAESQELPVQLVVRGSCGCLALIPGTSGRRLKLVLPKIGGAGSSKLRC
jgi:LacI family transcriptional regulator